MGPRSPRNSPLPTSPFSASDRNCPSPPALAAQIRFFVPKPSCPSDAGDSDASLFSFLGSARQSHMVIPTRDPCTVTRPPSYLNQPDRMINGQTAVTFVFRFLARKPQATVCQWRTPFSFSPSLVPLFIRRCYSPCPFSQYDSLLPDLRCVPSSSIPRCLPVKSRVTFYASSYTDCLPGTASSLSMTSNEELRVFFFFARQPVRTLLFCFLFQPCCLARCSCEEPRFLLD